MHTTRSVNLTISQELAVRRQAAAHLRGVPASQNAFSIDLLETKLLLAEIEARSSDKERALWESQECSLGLI